MVMAASRITRQIQKLAGKHRTRPASDVKARWRDIVDEVNAHGEVVVMNHNRPEVVVVSIDQYAKLKSEAAANDPLTTLRQEFDRELAILREPGTAGKLRKVFASSPARLAKAANDASRRRKH
jgi:prevent-host-death family protein